MAVTISSLKLHQLIVTGAESPPAPAREPTMFTALVHPDGEVVGDNLYFGSGDPDDGEAVAISGDGSTALIGACYDPRGAVDPSDYIGAAFVYARVGAGWVLEAELTLDAATDPDALFAEFGKAVAISADGNTAAVAAHYYGSDSHGAVFVYTRSGFVWTLQQKLEPPVPEGGDEFGFDLSLSSDGNTLAVVNGDNPTAFVFTRAGSTWSLAQTLVLDEVAASCALSGNGQRLALGQPSFQIDPYDESETPGRVLVYTLTNGTWTQEAILGWTYNPALYVGRFGEVGNNRPSFDAAGIVLAVAAPHWSSVAVFERTGGGWVRRALIEDENVFELGLGVALSSDGRTLAVSQSSWPGVYVYTAAAGGYTTWTRVYSYEPEGIVTGGAGHDILGNIGLTADGTRLLACHRYPKGTGSGRQVEVLKPFGGA